MNTRTRLLRLLLGLGILVVTLVVTFSLALAFVPRWGATANEVALALPGDDLAPRPLLNWTNAIYINAPPAEVWPWVAQLGDTRGGFYSYTFIEDRVGGLTGASGYDVDYENASRVVPEWQQPAPGLPLIQGSLRVREVVPGEYLLADSIDPSSFQWVWLWYVTPAANGEASRLIVRFRIQLPAGDENPVMTTVMTVGGFVMQQRMLRGIQIRAEGGVEPDYIETVEIGLWLTTLATALAGAGLFLARPQWQRPLALAVLATAVLVAFTFAQPAVWVRVVVNAGLLLGVWLAYQPTMRPRPAFRPQPVSR